MPLHQTTEASPGEHTHAGGVTGQLTLLEDLSKWDIEKVVVCKILVSKIGAFFRFPFYYYIAVAE